MLTFSDKKQYNCFEFLRKRRLDGINKSRKSIIPRIIACVIIFIGTLCFFSAVWYINVYGDLGFASIVFTLFSDHGATEGGIITDYLLAAVLPAAGVTGLSAFLIFFKPKIDIFVTFFKKKAKVYPFGKKATAVFTAFVTSFFFLSACFITGFFPYVGSLISSTALYDNEYIFPEKTEITFPEEKRNLIYIVSESLETTYMSKEEDGALPYNTIKELTELAENNINFSHNDSVGGWTFTTNTSWTVASLLAQSAGVPLTIPIGKNDYGKENFLPGIVTINDILDENGYNSAFLCGSDAAFGGRKALYTQHSTDNIYDLFSARKDGIIPKDYAVWWGYEDLHLFEYAKEILEKMSEGDEPFALTLLTVDTHHIGGYVCENCENEYAEQYENVFACSSRQIAEFISWIQEQDFYENTAVIICGDHPTMDAGYISRTVGGSYERHVYNCFINSAVTSSNTKNRIFTPMDMFPTTLSALGCKIKGDRLGLGTDLFSDTPTLAEKYGLAYLNTELAKNSHMYNSEFLNGEK